jgi:magnesium-transporting ATPase (P-type)
MITGDHPSAAIAVASQIGLIGSHDEFVRMLDTGCHKKGVFCDFWEIFSSLLISSK